MSVELDDRLASIARELDAQSPALTLTDLEGRHADRLHIDDQLEPKRHRSLLLLAASTALVVGGVVAVLAVSNNSASPTQTPSGSLQSVTTTASVVEDSCPRPRQSVGVVPSWVTAPDGEVFISACAFDEAMRVVDNPLPIDVYLSATGEEVVGWLYVACGLEGGYVEVGGARPANCAELSGVHVEDTEPVDSNETTPTEPTIESTTVPQESDPSTLSIPALGGPVVEPRPLTILSPGGGPGQLGLQNGEFGTRMIVLPDHLVIIEDAPFDGPTGRVIVLDPQGNWQFELNEPAFEGSNIGWQQGTPNGTILVETYAEDGSTVRISAYRLDGTDLVEINSADLDSIDVRDAAYLRPIVTPTGVDYPTLGEQVLAIETGVPTTEIVTTVVDPATPTSPALITVERFDTAPQAWPIQMVLDSTSPPDGAIGQAEPFGDGAWYRNTTSFSPGEVGHYLSVLQPDGTGNWWRLGGWSVAGYSAERIILTKTLVEGLQIAAIDAA